MAPLLALLLLAQQGTRLWSAQSVGGASALPPLGSSDATPGIVPKRIFTFWNDPNNIPDLVAGCIARMKVISHSVVISIMSMHDWLIPPEPNPLASLLRPKN